MEKLHTAQKIEMTSKEFEVFAKAIYDCFFEYLVSDEGAGHEEFKEKFPDWEIFFSKEKHFDDWDFSGVLAKRIDSFSDGNLFDRMVDKINSYGSEQVAQSEYAKKCKHYLFRRYRDGYKKAKKNNEVKKTTFGGQTKDPVNQYNDVIFFWFLHYENFNDFKKKVLSPEKAEAQKKFVNLFSNIFNRKGEWIRNEKIIEEFKGDWTIVARESELRVNSEEERFVESEAMVDEYLHNKDIEYKDLFSYVGSIVLTQSDYPPFFWAEGSLEINSPLEELKKWKLQSFCCLRRSKEDIYLRFDYEMTPIAKSEEELAQNFGYAIFTRRKDRDLKAYDGYYFSNRMRIPKKYSKKFKDDFFRDSLKISTGRCTLVKEPSK